jgi:hypothetical protein
MMRAVRSASRVRRRRGIFSVRSPDDGEVFFGLRRAPVAVFQFGKNSAAPGVVRYSRPVGERHTTVPSGSWRSAHPSGPVQNVFSR